MSRSAGLYLVLMLGYVAASDGATFHVSTNSPSDGPGTAWANAFHTIQQGVDAATNPGDVVLVTNGVYLLAAPIEVTDAVTVRSVNGAEHTSLVGVGSYGASAVRCAFLTNGTLSGFALSGGYTHNVNGTDHEKNGGVRVAGAGQPSDELRGDGL